MARARCAARGGGRGLTARGARDPQRSSVGTLPGHDDARRAARSAGQEFARADPREGVAEGHAAALSCPCVRKDSASCPHALPRRSPSNTPLSTPCSLWARRRSLRRASISSQIHRRAHTRGCPTRDDNRQDTVPHKWVSRPVAPQPAQERGDRPYRGFLGCTDTRQPGHRPAPAGCRMHVRERLTVTHPVHGQCKSARYSPRTARTHRTSVRRRPSRMATPVQRQER